MATTLAQLTQTQAAACCAPIAPARLDDEAVQRFTDALTVVAHPIRVQILDLLSRSAGDVCVCDLEAALPVKQPTVSHHLRMLREAGLIDCERRGLWAYYFVQRAAIAALRERIVAQLDAMS
jgi:ArsR family transcriptional regulator